VSTAPARVSRTDRYGKSSRFYRVEGKDLPSVTTVLQAINKPALLPWAAKLEREMALTAAAAYHNELVAAMPEQPMPAPWFAATVTERLGKQYAHAKELKAAGDIGSEAHAMIEWTLRGELGLPVEERPSLSTPALRAFGAWEIWRRDVTLEVEHIERTVYSHTYGYAGTMDWLGHVDTPDGRLSVLGDWKTGKAIYPEAMLQNAAYIHATHEMGLAEPPLAGCIVRLPKTAKDPGFEWKLIPADQMAGLLDVFLAALDLWKWLEKQK